MEENVNYLKIDTPDLFGYIRTNGKKAIFVSGKIIQYINFNDIAYDMMPSTKKKFDKAFHKLAYKINTQF